MEQKLNQKNEEPLFVKITKVQVVGALFREMMLWFKYLPVLYKYYRALRWALKYKDWKRFNYLHKLFNDVIIGVNLSDRLAFDIEYLQSKFGLSDGLDVIEAWLSYAYEFSNSLDEKVDDELIDPSKGDRMSNEEFEYYIKAGVIQGIAELSGIKLPDKVPLPTRRQLGKYALKLSEVLNFNGITCEDKVKLLQKESKNTKVI